MKVGIDVSSLHSLSKERGIGYYIRYLVDSLKEFTDIEVVVLETSGQKEKVDLVHFPFFDLFRPTLKIPKDVPAIVTIHDVIPLLFPEHYPPGIKGRINLFRQKNALKKVRAVITDSEASTNDVIKVFKLPSGIITSIYLAPARHFQKLSDTEIEKRIKKFNLPEKFILYSGGVNWNKNLPNQTEAALQTGLDVVFAGGGFEERNNLDHPELKDLRDFLSKYEKNPKVHILGFVSDQELVGLMNASAVLLFASRYEGFGLPILEAQNCGTPVITSHLASMTEVAGSGAIMVNPDSSNEIRAGIEKILEDEDYRENLIKKGYFNLKRFSWEKTALQTAKVYKQSLR